MEINSEQNLNWIAFSILRAILPTLSRSDINGVRIARPKLATLKSPDTEMKSPSFIITLKNSKIA